MKVIESPIVIEEKSSAFRIVYEDGQCRVESSPLYDDDDLTYDEDDFAPEGLGRGFTPSIFPSEEEARAYLFGVLGYSEFPYTNPTEEEKAAFAAFHHNNAL